MAVPAAIRHEGIDRMKKSQGFCDFFISVVGFSTKLVGKIVRIVNRPQKIYQKNLQIRIYQIYLDHKRNENHTGFVMKMVWHCIYSF
jgi:hypothetical protein